MALGGLGCLGSLNLQILESAVELGSPESNEGLGAYQVVDL